MDADVAPEHVCAAVTLFGVFELAFLLPCVIQYYLELQSRRLFVGAPMLPLTAVNCVTYSFVFVWHLLVMWVLLSAVSAEL